MSLNISESKTKVLQSSAMSKIKLQEGVSSGKKLTVIFYRSQNVNVRHNLHSEITCRRTAGSIQTLVSSKRYVQKPHPSPQYHRAESSDARKRNMVTDERKGKRVGGDGDNDRVENAWNTLRGHINNQTLCPISGVKNIVVAMSEIKIR